MDADLIEQLAEAVHRGWAEEKQAQGYTDHAWPACDCRGAHGEPHPIGTHWMDDNCSVAQDKHHPDMLPYADLAENIKEYDRATVRAVLRALDAAGLQIVQATTSRATAS